MKKGIGSAVTCVSVLMLISVGAVAQQGMGGAPLEAFNACSGSSEGSPCSMNTPRGEIVGNCATHEGGRVCIPERGQGMSSTGAENAPMENMREERPKRQRERTGPPQEAISACEGRGTGASCRFSAPRGEVSGSCLKIGETLACAPHGRLPQGTPPVR